MTMTTTTNVFNVYHFDDFFVVGYYNSKATHTPSRSTGYRNLDELLVFFGHFKNDLNC